MTFPETTTAVATLAAAATPNPIVTFVDVSSLSAPFIYINHSIDKKINELFTLFHFQNRRKIKRCHQFF